MSEPGHADAQCNGTRISKSQLPQWLSCYRSLSTNLQLPISLTAGFWTESILADKYPQSTSFSRSEGVRVKWCRMRDIATITRSFACEGPSLRTTILSRHSSRRSPFANSVNVPPGKPPFGETEPTCLGRPCICLPLNTPPYPNTPIWSGISQAAILLPPASSR